MVMTDGRGASRQLGPQSGDGERDSWIVTAWAVLDELNVYKIDVPILFSFLI